MLRNNEIVSERHVQAIWYDGTLRPGELRTAGGTPVRVVDPGRWNLEAGPDFLDAVLEIGDDLRRVRGDVEIHVRATDWAAHGHGQNPAYADVVAHVTWHPGPPPVADDGALPPHCVRICPPRRVPARPSSRIRPMRRSPFSVPQANDASKARRVDSPRCSCETATAPRPSTRR